MAEHYDDSTLLKQFRNPDTQNFAFNLIVKKFQQMLYKHIRRMVIDHDDADDILQDTFVKIWKNLENFREDAKLSTWMYTIATNEALSFLRKKKMRFFLPIGDITNELTSKLSNNQDLFDADEVQLKFQKALLTLPEKQRLVFNMKYFDEMKYEEISEVLGTSVGALKTSYHIAVKKIEEILKTSIL